MATRLFSRPQVLEPASCIGDDNGYMMVGGADVFVCVAMQLYTSTGGCVCRCFNDVIRSLCGGQTPAPSQPKCDSNEPLAWGAYVHAYGQWRPTHGGLARQPRAIALRTPPASCSNTPAPGTG